MNAQDKAPLKESLYQLDTYQIKLFYGILVHCWACRKAFISTQNFRNLWCELNYLCSIADEGFPDPYDYELLRSFCHAHPYYFIDKLSSEIIIDLFCEYVDDRLGIRRHCSKARHGRFTGRLWVCKHSPGIDQRYWWIDRTDRGACEKVFLISRDITQLKALKTSKVLNAFLYSQLLFSIYDIYRPLCNVSLSSSPVSSSSSSHHPLPLPLPYSPSYLPIRSIFKRLFYFHYIYSKL